MPSIQAITAIVAVALLPAMVNAGSVGLEDSGTAGGATGGGAACIPSCHATINDVLGCSGGTVDWSANCQQNYDNPKGTQDIGGCDGYQMTWLRDPSGNPVVDIYRKSDKMYDRYSVSNCQQASEGGSQCVPSGGGCDTSEVGVMQSATKRWTA